MAITETLKSIVEKVLSIGTPPEKEVLYKEVVKRKVPEKSAEALVIDGIKNSIKKIWVPEDDIEFTRGTPNPPVKKAVKKKTPAKKSTSTKKSTTKKPATKKTVTKKTVTKKTSTKTAETKKTTSTKKSTTTKKKEVAKKETAQKAPVKKAPAKKSASTKKSADNKSTTTQKASTKTATSKKSTSTKTTKATEKKTTTAKKPATTKAAAKKPAIKKETEKKTPAKKTIAKKTTTTEKKSPTKKTSTKKPTTKKETTAKKKVTATKGSKRDEKIALYIKDIKKHYGEVDEAFVAIIVKNLGPSIYRKDAELVSCSDPKELDTVRRNFLMKKLGIKASQGVLDAAIQDVCTELKGVRTKYRATFYYALAKKFKKESVLS